MSVREKLERAQKTAAEQVTKTQFGAYRRLDKAITAALAELDEGERIEGWATKYRQSDAIYFKAGDRKPKSKAGAVWTATLTIHKRKEGDQ